MFFFLDLNDPKKYQRRSAINLVLKGESCCYYRLTGKKKMIGFRNLVYHKHVSHIFLKILNIILCRYN